MKKTYVKPVLSSSMEGTLEGVYAYASTNGQLRCLSTNNGGNNSDDNGGNGGTDPSSVPASTIQPAYFDYFKYLVDLYEEIKKYWRRNHWG